MPKRAELAKTMRIDLIPDAPSEPVPGKKKRVVIASTAQERQRTGGRDSEGTPQSDYHELLESIYDAAVIADLTGRIVDVNARALDFLLYGREELCALSIVDVISGADEGLIDTLCNNLENERFTLIQAYCIRKDESLFPAEVAVNKISLGEDHLCFFIRDITVRRQAEEMLRTEHNAIQNSGNGIAVADLAAKLEYVNPAFAAMWGYDSPDELLGVDVRSVLGDADRAEEMIGLVLGAKQVWTGETTAKGRGGSELEVQVSAACNRNSDGEPVGIVFSFVNIADRKRAEEAERESERHRVMLESLGAACHHLGQPATVLLANLGVVQKRVGSSDPEVQELVSSSIGAAESLGDILHKLNAVNEYKTMRYIERVDGTGAAENRILEI